MNSKQTKTLAAIFTDPVSASIEWSAIENLLLAVGCKLIEGNGSRVRFEVKGIVASFHRLHPAKEAKRYQVRDVREFLEKDRSSPVNTIAYKGYTARIDFDGDDLIFVGHIAGINDVIGFHADTVGDLKAAFEEAVDDYIETCQKVGKAQEKPYSGKMMLRISPETHARVALAAQLEGISLNRWAERALEKESAA